MYTNLTSYQNQEKDLTGFEFAKEMSYSRTLEEPFLSEYAEVVSQYANLIDQEKSPERSIEMNRLKREMRRVNDKAREKKQESVKSQSFQDLESTSGKLNCSLSCKGDLDVGFVHISLGPKISLQPGVSFGRIDFDMSLGWNESSSGKGIGIEVSLLASRKNFNSNIATNFSKHGREHTVAAGIETPFDAFTLGVQSQNHCLSDLFFSSALLKNSKFTVAHKFTVQGRTVTSRVGFLPLETLKTFVRSRFSRPGLEPHPSESSEYVFKPKGENESLSLTSRFSRPNLEPDSSENSEYEPKGESKSLSLTKHPVPDLEDINETRSFTEQKNEQQSNHVQTISQPVTIHPRTRLVNNDFLLFASLGMVFIFGAINILNNRKDKN